MKSPQEVIDELARAVGGQVMTIDEAIVLSILVAAASLGVLSLSVHYSSIVLENVRTIGVVGFMDSVSIASVGVMMKWYKEHV